MVEQWEILNEILGLISMRLAASGSKLLLLSAALTPSHLQPSEINLLFSVKARNNCVHYSEWCVKELLW